MKPMELLRVIFAAAWKDLQVIFRDRGALIVIIGLPMVFAMLNGSVNQQMMKSGEGLVFPVAVLNEDTGAFGSQVVSILDSIDILDLHPAESRAAAEADVRESKVLAAIFLPADLTGRVNAHQPTEVEVMIDPTQAGVAAAIPGILNEVVSPIIVQGEVAFAIRSLLQESPGYAALSEAERGAVAAQSMAAEMAQVQKMSADPWIRVETRTSDSGDLVTLPDNMFALMVPSFTVMFAFFVVGMMAAELLKEKREGSLRRLMAAPIPRWVIIAGKMLAYLGLVLVQVVLIFGVGSLVFQMPLGKSPLGLLVLTIALGLSVTGLGMMLAALSKSEKQADSIGILLGFVLGALGGCFLIGSPVPLYNSGGILQVLSRLTPHAHALMGYSKLLNEGAGVVQILPQVGVLLGMALVFFLIAAWRFRFE